MVLSVSLIAYCLLNAFWSGFGLNVSNENCTLEQQKISLNCIVYLIIFHHSFEETSCNTMEEWIKCWKVTMWLAKKFQQQLKDNRSRET